MTATELIHRLTDLKNQYGDLKIHAEIWSGSDVGSDWISGISFNNDFDEMCFLIHNGIDE